MSKNVESIRSRFIKLLPDLKIIVAININKKTLIIQRKNFIFILQSFCIYMEIETLLYYVQSSY